MDTLNWLSGQLQDSEQSIHGGLSEHERSDIIEGWRNEFGPSALLVSIRAGSIGLNLQEASTVVLFDRWWNPALEMQAMQQTHRFGRDRPLHVLRFIVRGTIEERIVDLLAQKEQLFDNYVDQAPQATADTVTREELYNF